MAKLILFQVIIAKQAGLAEFNNVLTLKQHFGIVDAG
jgi:hypothetical protein